MFFVLLESPSRKKPIMGEDDIVKSGQVVRSSQTQRPSAPSVLRGSGSRSGGERLENAPPWPPPPLPPPQQPSHQNLFIQEEEMASWLHLPLREDRFYSGVVSTSATHPRSSVSLAPPPPPLASASRREENLMNFWKLRWNIVTGGRLEAEPCIPVVRESAQVDSNSTPSSSATQSCLTPVTVTESRAMVIGGVASTYAVPCPGRNEKAVTIEPAGTSSSGVSKAETQPIQIQPTTETEIPYDSKRKEREETIHETEETKESRGSTARKRSRAAEMHNISERRRRERINEKMKALQELIPRCNKSDRASMLDDVIEYVKSLQMHIQMTSMGGGMMPTMYTSNKHPPIPHTAVGMMDTNQPPFTAFPRPAHMAGQLGPSYPAQPYPFPNTQAFDPPRIQLPSQHPGDSVSNQPQFPGYLNPYSQFVGIHQRPQPPPLHMSFSDASSSKKPDDQHNQPTG